MKKELYQPTKYIKPEITNPVIFLAGPIQGSINWQEEATSILNKSAGRFIIASPRREYLPQEFDYGEQVDWETYHLRRAAENGVIMFWLPMESRHINGRSYAQTTRIELGEWKINHEQEGAKLVVGIERGFSGERYIRRRFAQDCPDVAILDNLIETCTTAVNLTKK